MPEYLAPGVYVEEIERGPKPIEGVATSTAAFLGETERGPSRRGWSPATASTSATSATSSATRRTCRTRCKTFFDNGGRRAYIARISGANAARGDRRRRRVHAHGHRAWGRRTTGCGSASSPGTTKDGAGDPVGFRLRVWYWAKADPTSRTTAAPSTPGDDPPGPEPIVTEDFDDLSVDPASPSYFVKRVNDAQLLARSRLVVVEAPRRRRSPAAAASAPLARRRGRRRRSTPARLPR